MTKEGCHKEQCLIPTVMVVDQWCFGPVLWLIVRGLLWKLMVFLILLGTNIVPGFSFKCLYKEVKAWPQIKCFNNRLSQIYFRISEEMDKEIQEIFCFYFYVNLVCRFELYKNLSSDVGIPHAQSYENTKAYNVLHGAVTQESSTTVFDLVWSYISCISFLLCPCAVIHFMAVFSRLIWNQKEFCYRQKKWRNHSE